MQGVPGKHAEGFLDSLTPRKKNTKRGGVTSFPPVTSLRQCSSQSIVEKLFLKRHKLELSLPITLSTLEGHERQKQEWRMKRVTFCFFFLE